MTHFTHRPSKLRNQQFVHPVHTKTLWNKVWGAARNQEWFADDVTLVGSDDWYFYFQKRGVTTGLARVEIR